MVMRAERLAQFNTDREPASDAFVEVLCQDGRGTYRLPFPCRWDGSRWLNAETDQELAVDVIGWRDSTSGQPQAAVTGDSGGPA